MGHYQGYGDNVRVVTKRVQETLRSDSRSSWWDLIDALSDRRRFTDSGRTRSFLARFGASRVFHGHTPIMTVTGQSPKEVTAPYAYAEGQAINLDEGMVYGGPGFVHNLGDEIPAPPPAT